MKYGIIGAMDKEISLMRDQLEQIEIRSMGGMEFFSGCWQGKQLVVVKSGICKVNAALCTQLLINSFGVDAVLFTGVAGALHPDLDVGDVVVSADALYHDVDATTFGYAPGQIPGHKLTFAADPSLAQAAVAGALRKLPERRVMLGRIVSGDSFIADKSKAAGLFTQFGGACVEMEGAAVAHTCHLNKVPFVIIRSMSDRADGTAKVDFGAFVDIAAANSLAIVQHIIGEGIH